MIQLGSSSAILNAWLYYFVLAYVVVYPILVGLFLQVAGHQIENKPYYEERFKSYYSGLFVKNKVCFH